jgi:hypothetical protein
MAKPQTKPKAEVQSLLDAIRAISQLIEGINGFAEIQQRLTRAERLGQEAVNAGTLSDTPVNRATQVAFAVASTRPTPEKLGAIDDTAKKTAVKDAFDTLNQLFNDLGLSAVDQAAETKLIDSLKPKEHKAVNKWDAFIQTATGIDDEGKNGRDHLRGLGDVNGKGPVPGVGALSAAARSAGTQLRTRIPLVGKAGMEAVLRHGDIQESLTILKKADQALANGRLVDVEKVVASHKAFEAAMTHHYFEGKDALLLEVRGTVRGMLAAAEQRLDLQLDVRFKGLKDVHAAYTTAVNTIDDTEMKLNAIALLESVDDELDGFSKNDLANAKQKQQEIIAEAEAWKTFFETAINPALARPPNTATNHLSPVPANLDQAIAALDAAKGEKAAIEEQLSRISALETAKTSLKATINGVTKTDLEATRDRLSAFTKALEPAMQRREEIDAYFAPKIKTADEALEKAVGELKTIAKSDQAHELKQGGLGIRLVNARHGYGFSAGKTALSQMNAEAVHDVNTALGAFNDAINNAKGLDGSELTFSNAEFTAVFDAADKAREALESIKDVNQGEYWRVRGALDARVEALQKVQDKWAAREGIQTKYALALADVTRDQATKLNAHIGGMDDTVLGQLAGDINLTADKMKAYNQSLQEAAESYDKTDHAALRELPTIDVRAIREGLEGRVKKLDKVENIDDLANAMSINGDKLQMNAEGRKIVRGIEAGQGRDAANAALFIAQVQVIEKRLEELRNGKGVDAKSIKELAGIIEQTVKQAEAGVHAERNPFGAKPLKQTYGELRELSGQLLGIASVLEKRENPTYSQNVENAYKNDARLALTALDTERSIGAGFVKQ